jgi:hypothetical protein
MVQSTLAPRKNETVIVLKALVRGVRDGRLTVADCRLLLCVRILQAVATAAVHFASIPTIRAALAAVRPVAVAVRGTVPEARVLWAFQASDRWSVGRATCLARALAAEVLLETTSHQHRMVIGISSPLSGGLRSHAWIERNGDVLLGGQESRSQYVPLIAWSGVAR